MPRDIAYSHESFVMVTIDDIQRLQKHKASGLTMRVWFILKQHCFDYQAGNRFCFPSLYRIKEMLGYEGKNYVQTIGRCLRWLENAGFVKRQQARKKHEANKERFELLTEVKPNSSIDTEHKGLHKKTTKNKNNLPSFNPSQGKEVKTTRKRLSKSERKQRRYERACERALQANEQRLQEEQRRRDSQMSDWVLEHRTAQDNIKPLFGSKEFEDQMTLLMARYSYEKRHSEVWLYEPPQISETPLRIDSVVLYIRSRRPFRNPYFDIFCWGASLSDFEQWFRASHGEAPRL